MLLVGNGISYSFLLPCFFSLFVDGDPYIRASHNFAHGLRGPDTDVDYGGTVIVRELTTYLVYIQIFRYLTIDKVSPCSGISNEVNFLLFFEGNQNFLYVD